MSPVPSDVAAPPRRPGLAPASAAAAEMLDGGEIIELSIRPSPWSIGIRSFYLVFGAVLAMVALSIVIRSGASVWLALALQATLAAVVLRVFAATMQWASRLYVLTNRRVLCFQGVFSVRYTACPLQQIADVTLRTEGLERTLRLGSLYMHNAENRHVVIWRYVARPRDVLARVQRAIHNAR